MKTDQTTSAGTSRQEATGRAPPHASGYKHLLNHETVFRVGEPCRKQAPNGSCRDGKPMRVCRESPVKSLQTARRSAAPWETERATKTRAERVCQRQDDKARGWMGPVALVAPAPLARSAPHVGNPTTLVRGWRPAYHLAHAHRWPCSLRIVFVTARCRSVACTKLALLTIWNSVAFFVLFVEASPHSC